MKKLKAAACFVVVAAVGAIPVLADAGSTGVIAVAGSAERDVATDELRIRFDMTTEGPSFAEARAEATDIGERLRQVLLGVHDGPVEVESEIVVLRNKRFSWNSKAKKLDHQFNVTIRGLERGSTELAISLIDAAMGIDPRLELVEVLGELSHTKKMLIESEILAEALANARQSAVNLATEADIVVLGARVINAAPGYSPAFSGGISESVSVYSSFSRARSYTASSDLVGTAKVSVKLVAEFETEPTN